MQIQEIHTQNPPEFRVFKAPNSQITFTRLKRVEVISGSQTVVAFWWYANFLQWIKIIELDENSVIVGKWLAAEMRSFLLIVHVWAQYTQYTCQSNSAAGCHGGRRISSTRLRVSSSQKSNLQWLCVICNEKLIWCFKLVRFTDMNLWSESKLSEFDSGCETNQRVVLLYTELLSGRCRKQKLR